MRKYRVTGFSKYGVWSIVEVKTIPECISMRAVEKGIETITNIEEM